MITFERQIQWLLGRRPEDPETIDAIVGSVIKAQCGEADAMSVDIVTNLFGASLTPKRGNRAKTYSVASVAEAMAQKHHVSVDTVERRYRKFRDRVIPAVVAEEVWRDLQREQDADP